MELKQLEYFVTTVKEGSLSKASESLYTSQPNISKVIRNLERELNCVLLHRENRGVRLTLEGERLYEHAVTILRNAALMKSSIGRAPLEKFSVSSYPSHMISRIFCEHFNESSCDHVDMNFLEGTLEEAVHHVEEYRSDIGVIFFPQFQKPYVNHMTTNKNLEFVSLTCRSICVYAGKHSPYFQRETVSFEDLPYIRFVQSSVDFFSMEHQLEDLSLGRFRGDQFHVAVRTNCDNLLIDMLQNTDLCNLGIHFMIPDYKLYGIRAVPVEDCANCLEMGFVKRKDAMLSRWAKTFIKRLSDTFSHLDL